MLSLSSDYSALQDWSIKNQSPMVLKIQDLWCWNLFQDTAAIDVSEYDHLLISGTWGSILIFHVGPIRYFQLYWTCPWFYIVLLPYSGFQFWLLPNTCRWVYCFVACLLCVGGFSSKSFSLYVFPFHSFNSVLSVCAMTPDPHLFTFHIEPFLISVFYPNYIYFGMSSSSSLWLIFYLWIQIHIFFTKQKVHNI